MIVIRKYINEVSYKIIGRAIEVHKHLGPGLLVSVCESCFIEEIINVPLALKSQRYVPINYKGKDLGGVPKLDLLVNDLIIIEEKAVDLLIPLYKAQLLSFKTRRQTERPTH